MALQGTKIFPGWGCPADRSLARRRHSSANAVKVKARPQGRNGGVLEQVVRRAADQQPETA